jgi:alkylation response protein AidB-like acyl-CoA dehydrogenase
MDFALTREQEALRDTARAYLAGRDRESWPELAALGWFDAELSTVELALLAEETGYARYPGRWWAAVGLAGPVLRAAGRAVEGPATLAWAEPDGPDGLASAARHASSTVDGDGALRGRKVLVPHADPDVETVVVVRGAAGVELRTARPVPVEEPVALLDPDRPMGGLALDGVPSEPLVDAAGTPDVLALVRRRTLALLAAEAVGVAARALALATEYAGIRTQFGRPIGANQGVAHPLVDGYAQIEIARSLAYRAAWAVDAEAGRDADRAVAAATIASREAATGACETAIQTLGGTGFTWEHPIHLWYRRAWWIATFDGGVAGFRAELAGLLLDATG